MAMGWLKEFVKMESKAMKELIAEEQKVWDLPHKLDYDEELQKQQLDKLPSFGRDLLLCYHQTKLHGMEYKHWYVTDGTHFIEFGNGDSSNEFRTNKTSILVHTNKRWPKKDDRSKKLRQFTI